VVTLVDPMVVLDEKKITTLESLYPTRNDEYFSMTVINQKSLEEEEFAWGSSGTVHNTTPGTGRVYDGTVKTHIGPTLRIEAKFQQVGGLNGEGDGRGGTLADLLEKTREEGVADSKTLCNQSLPADPSSVPLWNNKLVVNAEVYDNVGQFVDNFSLSQDSISSTYLNDGGVAVFYFSLEPNKKDGMLHSSTGRAYGNGAYVIRGAVRAISTYQFCAGEYSKGQRLTNSSTLLQLFGYRRANF